MHLKLLICAKFYKKYIFHKQNINYYILCRLTAPLNARSMKQILNQP